MAQALKCNLVKESRIIHMKPSKNNYVLSGTDSRCWGDAGNGIMVGWTKKERSFWGGI